MPKSQLDRCFQKNQKCQSQNSCIIFEEYRVSKNRWIHVFMVVANSPRSVLSTGKCFLFSCRETMSTFQNNPILNFSAPLRAKIESMAALDCNQDSGSEARAVPEETGTLPCFGRDLGPGMHRASGPQTGRYLNRDPGFLYSASSPKLSTGHDASRVFEKLRALQYCYDAYSATIGSDYRDLQYPSIIELDCT